MTPSVTRDMELVKELREKAAGKRNSVGEKLTSGAAAFTRGGSITRIDSTTRGRAVADGNRAFNQRSRINQTAWQALGRYA